MMMLSFVIPCYRSEKTIQDVINEIEQVVAQRTNYDYEVIAVNDCSPDNVYEVLKNIAAENKRIKVINFARNMGKHSAVMAGYSVAKGEYIVNMDDDGQCPMNELWTLVDAVVADECDVATAEYHQKKESVLKRIGSNVNLWMTEILLEKPKGLRMENFTVEKRFVTEEKLQYKGPYPYLEGLTFRATKNVKVFPMEERGRGDGNVSGFTLKKSISLLLNGLTAFSVKPLRIASVIGFLFSAIGMLYGLIIVIKKLLNPDIAMGYSSMMAVLLFSMGMIMLMLGLIGEYLGRIYISINASPQYVIRNTINIDEG